MIYRAVIIIEILKKDEHLCHNIVHHFRQQWTMMYQFMDDIPNTLLYIDIVGE